MSNTMVTVVVLLGFAGVAGLFVYLTVLDAGKWGRKMQDALEPTGFRQAVSKPEKAALAARLGIAHPRHMGRRLVKYLYSRPCAHGNAVLCVCDCYFASAGGKARGSNMILVCLISDALDLPRFNIDCLPSPANGPAGRLFGALSEAVEIPGMRRLRSGDEALDQRLHLYTEPAMQQLPISLELLRQLNNAQEGVALAADADMLVLSSTGMARDRVRGILDSQQLQRLLQLAIQLHTALRK